MPRQLTIGSWRAFSIFLGCLVAFDVLVEVYKRHSLVNKLSVGLWLFLILASSVMLFIRMWRKRHNPVEFWKSSHRHSGELSVLSAKWRRGVFREED
jgi:hypothetical protein